MRVYRDESLNAMRVYRDESLNAMRVYRDESLNAIQFCREASISLPKVRYQHICLTHVRPTIIEVTNWVQFDFRAVNMCALSAR